MSWVAVAVGAAAGAGLGAIAGSAKGGDAIWKGALTGAVAGAASGGMYSWAPLGAGAVGGALAGGTGGLVSGALGTALNGGNSSDYLRNMFTQGATGAVLGGAGGAAFGPTAGEVGGPVTAETAGNTFQYDSVTGEMIPADSVIASGMNVGNTTSPTVQQSITGPTAAPTQGATPTLQDTTNTLAGNQYAAANTGNMTDIGGSSAIPQELPGSYQTSSSNNFPGLQMPTAENSGTGLDLSGNVGINPPENALMPELTTTEGKSAIDGISGYKPSGEYSAETLMPGTKQPSAWDKFWNKGMGKMDFNDYLSGMGKAQLIGGGLKTLGAIATAPETARNRQQLMDLYNQQNEQNQFYANQLQQTYQNPQSYLGSAEAQATRSAALRKALAVNAEAGRRTQGGALSNLLMQEQLKNLGAYRQGMPRPNYGTAAQVYQNAAQYSPTADIFGGLASGVTPLSLMSLYGGA